MSLLREVKPKTKRIARILKKREPQQTEPPKQTLLLHGPKCPLPLTNFLTTISQLTAPHSVRLHKKNENIHPFENAESLEFLCGKNECGIFVYGSHSKKRPLGVTIGRIFGGKVLEVGELGLIRTDADTELNTEAKGGRGPSRPKLAIPVGVQPMLVFAGSAWDDTATSWDSTAYNGNPYPMWKSLFTDLFRSGEDSKKVDVEGLRYILLIAAGEPDASNPLSTTTTSVTSPSNRAHIHLRWYTLTTFKSPNSSKLPRIEVTSLGPRYSFRLNRFKEPDPSLWTEAMKKAAGQESKDGRGKKKNIGVDSVGDKIGRVHLGRQDLSELQTRKMRGLKRGVGEDEDDAVGGELELDDIEAEDGRRSVRKKAKL